MCTEMGRRRPWAGSVQLASGIRIRAGRNRNPKTILIKSDARASVSHERGPRGMQSDAGVNPKNQDPASPTPSYETCPHGPEGRLPTSGGRQKEEKRTGAEGRACLPLKERFWHMGRSWAERGGLGLSDCAIHY